MSVLEQFGPAGNSLPRRAASRFAPFGRGGEGNVLPGDAQNVAVFPLLRRFFHSGASMTNKTLPASQKSLSSPSGYALIHGGIVELLDTARKAAVRSVNALMTASYWDIGRRIVEAEQNGNQRAGYGEQLMERLSADLTSRFGRGFSPDNLENMRRFFVAYSHPAISETVSRKLDLSELSQAFTLPWSAYVRLLSVRDQHARQFYEAEALRGGWSVRQLDRQISSQFYERTALSRDKAAMLEKGAVPKPEDVVTPDEAIKDPYVLEFLDLKDEYSESELETALIQRLESFLLELGEGFTFVGRQRRLRIDHIAWICCCSTVGCAAWSSSI